MKTPRRSRRTALVLAGSIEALVAVLAFNATAFAAAITWDNGGLDQLWSNALNWNPDSAASGNDVTFGATGVAAAGTVTNIVDSSVTTNSLTFTNTGGAASAHTTQINPSQTLTVNGAAGFVLNSTGSLSSNVVITGSTGAFTVNGGSTAAFSVGVVTSAAAATQTLDMSGLGTFTANVGTFGLGTGARQAGVVKLASTNAITATTISVGTNTGTAGPASSLTLGLTNVINADTFNVGNGRDSGTISFATGLTGATVTIANRAGTGAANLTAGDLNTNASGGGTGTIDFSGGSVTGAFGTITLGRGASSTAGGGSNGSLIFGAGSITATTMNVGNGNNGTVAAGATGTGTVTMNANAGTLTATTVVLGKQTNAAATVTGNGNGTFNQNGGTAAITTLTIGDRTGATSTTNGNVIGTYNLAGGTLKAQTIQAGGNGTGGGTATRAFNWTDGTIQNLNSATDLTIASTNGLSLSLNGASTLSFNADSGRNITANAVLTGTNGFTKNGAGTLTLTGANNYNGATAVSGGTVLLGGTGAINSSSGVSINGSGAKFVQTSSVASTPAVTLTQGTLDGTTTVGNVTVGANTGGIVANGNVVSNTALSLGSLNFTGAGAVSLRLPGGATTASPGLVVTNALTTSGTVTVNLTPAAAWVNGNIYNLIGYGSFTGANSNFALGSAALSGRQSGTFGNTGATNGFITLDVEGDQPVWTGANGGQWIQYAVNSAISGSPNFALKTAHTATDFWNSDTVEFNDTYNLGAGNVAVIGTTVTIHGGNVSPTVATFNNTTVSYTVTSDDGSGIAAGSLTKNGDGMLTLSSSNSYTGGTIINGGTVVVNSASSLGVSSGTATINAATLRTTADITSSRNFALGASTSTISVDSRTTYTLSGTVGDGSSAGTLNKVGAGTLVMSNTNNYTGGTNFNNGVLNVGNASALGSAGSLNFGGGTLQYGTGITADFSSRIAAGTSSGAVSIDTNGNNVTFATALTALQSGGLTKLGAGTLTLSGANAFTGGIALNAGALTINNALGGGSNTITAANGTTINAGSGVGSNSVANAITLSGINANVTLTNANASGGFTSNFAGSVDQTLTISNAGGQNVNANATTKEFQNFLGTVEILSGSALVDRSSSTTWTNGGDNTLFDVNGTISSRNGGNWALGALSGTGTLTMGGSGSNGLGLTYTIGARGTNTIFGGVIADGDTVNGKLVSVVKTGTAIQAFSGASTFTGSINVNDGTLVADLGNNNLNPTTSALGNPQVARNINVHSGGTLKFNQGDTLGGTTTNVAATLVINNGGTVTNAGNNITTLGAVQLNGGILTGTGGANADFQMYNLRGTVTVGGASASTISSSGTNAGYHLAAPTTFNVADATGDANSDLNISASLIDQDGGTSGFGHLGASGALMKSGTGTMKLTGVNTFTGTTTVSAGILNIQNATALGTTAAGTTVSNGATLQLQGNIAVGAEALTLNGGAAAGQSGALVNASGTNTYGGAITVAASSSISALTGSILNLTGGVVKDGTTATFNGGGTINITGVGISGVSANSDLVVDGAGTKLVLGIDNTYNGPTTIQNSGTLEVSSGGWVVNSTAIAVNSGGTLLLSGTGGTDTKLHTASTLNLNSGSATVAALDLSGLSSSLNQTFGVLTLSANSIIDFGTLGGGNTLHFAPSNADWTLLTLSIYNWTYGVDHLFFGTDTSGLNNTGPGTDQLSHISFYSDGGSSLIGGLTDISSFGEVIAPVPEPSSIATVMGLLGLVGWRERRKMRQARSAERQAWV